MARSKSIKKLIAGLEPDELREVIGNLAIELEMSIKSD